MISQGTNDFTPRICIGKISATMKITNLSEFTTNCGTGPGTSGGPIVSGGIDGTNGNWHSVVGLTHGIAEPHYGKQLGITTSHVAIPVVDAEIARAIDSLLKSQDTVQ